MDIGAVQLSIGLTDAFGQATVTAILSNTHNLMEIVIFEQTLGLPGFDMLRMDLPDAVRTAVMLGSLFDIGLLIDRDQGTAAAALVVHGVEFVTSDLTLSRLATQDIRYLNTQVFVHDFIGVDLGSDDSLSVELHELHVSVPEPGTLALLGIGLLGLGVPRFGRPLL